MHPRRSSQQPLSALRKISLLPFLPSETLCHPISLSLSLSPLSALVGEWTMRFRNMNQREGTASRVYNRSEGTSKDENASARGVDRRKGNGCCHTFYLFLLSLFLVVNSCGRELIAFFHSFLFFFSFGLVWLWRFVVSFEVDERVIGGLWIFIRLRILQNVMRKIILRIER